MVNPKRRPTAAALFWSCYLFALLVLILALWPDSSRAAPPAWPPGTRCILALPGREPAPVEIGQPLQLTDGRGPVPGYWITPIAPRLELVSVWIAAASSLKECRP